jgi:hypothetical protein
MINTKSLDVYNTISELLQQNLRTTKISKIVPTVVEKKLLQKSITGHWLAAWYMCACSACSRKSN